MDADLHDWEVLDDSALLPNTTYLDEIERDSEGIIRSDYFSIDSPKYSQTHLQDVTDQISDDPNSIDPVRDSITEPIADTEASNIESAVVEIESRHDESLSESGEIELKPSVDEKLEEESEASGDEKAVEAIQEGGNEVVENVKADGGGRNVVAVWWKLPMDLLKYCLFKASPVWTLSVAAAMMGVVILGRRLYKMKQKTRTLQLKVAIDDKKVSQVMSRAARLNEAFSVVKRAPIIRPSLPAAGISPWAMMALR